MKKKKGNKKQKYNLNGEIKRQIEFLENLPYVAVVSICGFDKINSHLQNGCYFDPKAKNGYCRGTNGIPLVIVDKKKPGGLKIVVHARPGHYDDVNRTVSNYIYDGCGEGRVTKDKDVLRHISNIDSLEEVARRTLGDIVMIQAKHSSGIYDIARSNGTMMCRIVGNAPDLALKCSIIARNGYANDLEWIMRNYNEYFMK